MAAAKPFWETLTQEERVQLLTIPLEDLRQKAKEVTERQQELIGMSLTGNSPQLGAQSCTPLYSVKIIYCNFMTPLSSLCKSTDKNILLRQ